MHGFDTGNDDASAAKGLESQHGPCDPFNGPMVLFDDVVEILRLAHRDDNTTVGLDADDGGLVGPAFVDGDFLGHVVQADSPFEECAGRGMIALGTQQKINGGAVLVYCPVQVLLSARDLDVGLVHAPAPADRPFAPTAYCGQHGQHLDGPPVDG